MEKLSSDGAIESQKDDRLDRGPLVDIVARHVLALEPIEPCVVLALNAPWGAGKSSFLNLLEEKLKTPTKCDANRGKDALTPIVVRFNPWHYTNVDQLVLMFFNELAQGIGETTEIHRQIGGLIRGMGKSMTVFAPVIASLLGVPWGGKLASLFGSAIDQAGSSLEKEKGLSEQKSQLNECLSKLSQRVVVFIDDIDRLEREALRMLFRMIRLNADFTNVTYILAFDRNVVECNLSDINGVRGRDYLEKIVQVAFDIPEPERTKKERLLREEIEKVFVQFKERMRPFEFDSTRWYELRSAGFVDLFRTVRHIRRYANSLRITFAAVPEEIDPYDFLAIEALRIFCPEIYAGVAHAESFLIPERTTLDTDAAVIDQRKEWFENLCDNTNPEQRESVQKLLFHLFLELARIHGKSPEVIGYSGLGRGTGRIYSHDAFDKYFLLSVPEEEVSDVEMQAFIDVLSDREKARTYIRSMKTKGKDRRLLERLMDFTSGLSAEKHRCFYQLLFDEGDDLRFTPKKADDNSAEELVPYFINSYLIRLGSEPERYNELSPLVKSGAALYTVVETVFRCRPNGITPGNVTVDDSHWNNLRDKATQRIVDAADGGALWSLRNLPYLLQRWYEWAGLEPLRRAVDVYLETDDNFISFLNAFKSKSLHFEKKALMTFVSIDHATTRLRRILDYRGNHTRDDAFLLKSLEETTEEQ